MCEAQFSTDIRHHHMAPRSDQAKTSKGSDGLPAHCARLEAVLKAKGLGSTECSALIGASNAYVSHVVKGRIPNPSGEHWRRIAEVTGSTISYLLEGEGPMFRDPMDPERHRFPSRHAQLIAAQGLRADLVNAVTSELLADNDHETDPGPAYWAAKLSSLLTKYDR